MSDFRSGRAGVLIGPSAGNGRAFQCETALAGWLSGREVAVCEGRFSGSGAQAGWSRLAAAAAGAGGRAEKARGYLEDLRTSVAAFAAWGADLLVCVGGDGLASYAADAMLASGRRMAMMGIAAGTINAGPIVSIGGEALDSGVLDDLRTESVAAVEKNQMFSVAFDQLENSWSYWHFDQMGTMDQILAQAIDQFERRVATPKAALEKAAADLQAEIDD